MVKYNNNKNRYIITIFQRNDPKINISIIIIKFINYTKNINYRFIFKIFMNY